MKRIKKAILDEDGELALWTRVGGANSAWREDAGGTYSGTV